MTLLSARGVALPGRLQSTDLDLARGGLTAVIGPNGAGKTSLLHALAGIGRPHGLVRIAGRDLADVPPRVRSGLLGYVPASRDFAWPLSVTAFVTLTAPDAEREEVARLLADFALDGLADRRIDSLSTGERTRALVARALLPHPSMLLLDEPFANLDPWWRLRLAERLRAVAEGGTAVLFSAHDLDLAGRDADRVIVVDRGAIVGDGAWSDLEEVVTRVFGVRRDAAGWVRAD